MHIMFFMIGVSLLIALGFLGAFVWSMRTGQQDDLYTPALRMLLDDTVPDDSVAAKPSVGPAQRRSFEQMTPAFKNPSTTAP